MMVGKRSFPFGFLWLFRVYVKLQESVYIGVYFCIVAVVLRLLKHTCQVWKEATRQKRWQPAYWQSKQEPPLLTSYWRNMKIRLRHQVVVVTLPETNSSHPKMDGWNTFSDGLFQGICTEHHGFINRQFHPPKKSTSHQRWLRHSMVRPGKTR